MKKNKIIRGFLGSILCAALAFWAPLMADAAEGEECYHDWEETGNYQKSDADSHLAEMRCIYCGKTETVSQEHDYDYDGAYDSYEDLDKKYHNYIYASCDKCGETFTMKEEHDWEESEPYAVDNTYHATNLTCEECGRIVVQKAKHTKPYWEDEYKIEKYATIYAKGKESYKCEDCGKKLYRSTTWKRNTFYSRSYDISHATIWNKAKKATVYLDSPSKGAVIKLNVGKNKYSYKIKNTKKTQKIKIKKATYGQKISVSLYYKGKKIGVDRCNDDNRVWYSNKVRVGMTKNQVKYTWGAPERTSSSSNGYSYWFWNDGSYVGFKSGKVKFWYNAGN